MKLNKIRLALVSIGFLTALPVYALTDVYEDGAGADAASSYSTAVGAGAEAGNGLTWGRTNTSGTATYGTSVTENDITTVYTTDSNGVITYSDRTVNTNVGSVAIGQNSAAGTGTSIKYSEADHGGTSTGTDYAYGHGYSSAIGTNSLADWGGTAIGADATATGRDSVGIGKEVMVTGHKAVGIGEDTVSSGYRSTAVGNSSEASAKWATALGAEAVADEFNALAVGRLAQSNAEGAVAIGNQSEATGENSVAIGFGAIAEGENSVALGADSVASRSNNVSVGSEGAERTISNVAPGVYGTDAVNVNQLKAVERKISAGVSAAMAMTTPVIAPGKSNGVALGAASYNNTSAIALNLAHKFTDDVVATASVSKGFNSGRTSSGSNDDIGIKGSVSWSF
jgi:hypothetical protein